MPKGAGGGVFYVPFDKVHKIERGPIVSAGCQHMEGQQHCQKYIAASTFNKSYSFLVGISEY